MVVFLTGNFITSNSQLDERNNLVEELKQVLPKSLSILIIDSDHLDKGKSSCEAIKIIKQAFRNVGFRVRRAICQNSSRSNFDLQDIDLLVLTGKNFCEQRELFKRMNLKAVLSEFKGVVLCDANATINSATVAYTGPECLLDNNYESEAEKINFLNSSCAKFTSGLGLTDLNILPNFNIFRSRFLSGRRIIEDIIIQDSIYRSFYALCEGAFVISYKGAHEIRGEAYLIRNGSKLQICFDGCAVNI